MAVLEIPVQVTARAVSLAFGPVFVPGDPGLVNLELLAKPGDEFDATGELGLADALLFKIPHEFDANVPLKIVFGVGLGFILERAGLEDSAIGCDQEMVGQVRPMLVGLAPLLHVLDELHRIPAGLPGDAGVVDRDKLRDVLAGIRERLRLRAPFLAADDFRPGGGFGWRSAGAQTEEQ